MTAPGTDSTAVHVAFVTAPDTASAEAIGSALVAEHLAACVNVLPIAMSIYRWQGQVESEPEVLLVIKTAADRLDRLRERLPALHPYDEPELIAWPVTAGLPGYLEWVVGETRP